MRTEAMMEWAFIVFLVAISVSHALYIDALRRKILVVEEKEENTWKAVHRLSMQPPRRQGW
jgi:hypothetical protein